MERSLAVLWTCLLGAGLTLALPPAFTFTAPKTESQPPRLIGCVFHHRANVTCRWEAGDTPTTHYTLKVERRAIMHSGSTTFSCTTSDNNCTAITGSSVNFKFCVSITAHGGSGDITSHPRCQSGRTEVMLPPVTLNSVKPVGGRPQCLNVIWSRTLGVFPASDSEIKAGNLNSQIEFTAQGQSDVQVSDVAVTGYSFLVCLFRPDTLYTVRLRHRYMGPESPWSPWSNGRQGRTQEEAPSAAPAFWRQVKQVDEKGQRAVSLLWKPLPRNDRVLFFNVTCGTESAQVLNDHGSCRDLRHTNTNCSLLLPAGRCSCSLTASTSVGTSPEAYIWFRGASETELPPPSQIDAHPLNDSSLDVHWTAPVDPSASGFVVEWFAVREKNSSILHWERLNSSCTALVITEGVKPMERYVVSVKALYGEQGAGQNRTVHVYTRQGAPSAGPAVQVQKISGSTVELVWAPVPVELLHGFIRIYTIYYTTANQPASVSVSSRTHRYSLESLAPGNYEIFMRANTDAGAGAAGPIINVHIGSDEISIVMYTLLPLILTSLALVLMACLAQMAKQKLHKDIPDPSHSSLARWTPKNAVEIMKRPAMAESTEIRYSEVILLGESEQQNSNPDQDITYQSNSPLWTYSSHSYSPLKVSAPQTPQNTRKSEKKCNQSSTRARTTSNTDLSSCPSIYSNVLFSQTLKSVPTPLLSPYIVQSNDWQHTAVSINDSLNKIQLSGDSEPPVSLQGRRATSTTRSDSPLSQTDELKTVRHFLRQHQSPVSFSDFSRISRSSVLLSHPVEVTSPQCLFSQSLYNSAPSLKPDTFTHPDAPADTFTTSLSPFPAPVFVGFSYCPVQSDPYIPPAV